jgi:hypothetical protein
MAVLLLFVTYPPPIYRVNLSENCGLMDKLTSMALV